MAALHEAFPIRQCTDADVADAVGLAVRAGRDGSLRGALRRADLGGDVRRIRGGAALGADGGSGASGGGARPADRRAVGRRAVRGRRSPSRSAERVRPEQREDAADGVADRLRGDLRGPAYGRRRLGAARDPPRPARRGRDQPARHGSPEVPRDAARLGRDGPARASARSRAPRQRKSSSYCAGSTPPASAWSRWTAPGPARSAAPVATSAASTTPTPKTTTTPANAAAGCAPSAPRLAEVRGTALVEAASKGFRRALDAPWRRYTAVLAPSPRRLSVRIPLLAAALAMAVLLDE